MKYLVLLAFSALAALSCRPAEQTPLNNTNAVQVALDQGAAPNTLQDYWYQGKAELSRYTLSQNRYQDTHPGEVVMIFVTEDFLTDKQVKNDHYTNPNSVSVLKNNIVKSFPTGIYSYHIMTSVFTPVNTPKPMPTLKVSNSSQEWCGQTYMQVNYAAGRKTYDYHLHSYFEGEADQIGQVPVAWLEEELFNRIRINPEVLPTGTIQVLPSTEYTRLSHRPYAPMPAQATLTDYTGEDFAGPGLGVYILHYTQANRTLEIVFEREAPYRIAGWRDTYPSMFDKQLRTTIAKRTHTIMDAYWQHNALEDMARRAELGLD